MARPAPQDASEFYHGYINHAKGNSVAEVMANHSVQLKEFYNKNLILSKFLYYFIN